jgi:hypothetical protein
VDLLVAGHAGSDAEAEDNVLWRTAVPLVQVQSKGRSLLRVDVKGGNAGTPFTLRRTSEDVERELKTLAARLELLNQELREPGLLGAKRDFLTAKVAEVVSRRERLASAPLEAPFGPNSISVRFIPLEATLPQDAAVQAIMERYDQDVAQLNLAWAREHGKDCTPAAPGQASYVGNEACRACHAQAFGVYDETRHARSYEALAKAGKEYRVDCVVCHVTGYEQPGGVCRVDKVAGRTEVGCETCHGPGSRHAATPSGAHLRPKPGKSVCLGCHNQENSPAFDFALYLPKVLGKGHGAPLAR